MAVAKNTIKSKTTKASTKNTKPVIKKTAVKKVKLSDKPAIVSVETTKFVEEVSVETLDRDQTETNVLAKAGKRSAKSIKEASLKAAKEERKAESAKIETSEKLEQHLPIKPARTRLERRGKKFREAAKLIEKDKLYPLPEAIDLALKTSPTKFDASVELHVNLNVDPRQSDQNVRDTLVLPAGTGKTLRVAVFSDDKMPEADISGVETITELLEKGQLNFDILISTPNNMSKLSKYARILGPRGLMPNPKSGTVTTDLLKALSEAKAGRVEYRVDSAGIIHLAIGKVSAGKVNILDNAQAILASIRSNKPASVKSGYIKTIHITTSMGPSVRISLDQLIRN